MQRVETYQPTSAPTPPASQFGGAQWLAVVHWAMKTNNRECATYLFFASCAACRRVETYQPTSAFPTLVFAMLLARMYAHDASLRQAGFAQTYSRHSRTKPSVCVCVCVCCCLCGLVGLSSNLGVSTARFSLHNWAKCQMSQISMAPCQ